MHLRNRLDWSAVQHLRQRLLCEKLSKIVFDADFIEFAGLLLLAVSMHDTRHVLARPRWHRSVQLRDRLVWFDLRSLRFWLLGTHCQLCNLF